MNTELTTCLPMSPVFDMPTEARYNEDAVRQIAEEAAHEAVANILARLTSGAAMLDNSKGNTSSEKTNGGTDMSSRIKAKITINGQTQWVCGESAQKLADNILGLTQQPEVVDAVTFSEYASKYFTLYKTNGSIEMNTLVGYRSYMKNHLEPFFGNMPINKISVDDVQRYINQKAPELASKTIKEHLNLLRPIFDAAIEDGLIVKNPCSSSRIKIIGQKSKRVLAYTEEEYKQLETLLPFLNGSAQIFLALSLYTGMRQGEQFALRWENVNLDAKELYVKQAVAWPAQNQGILKSPKTTNGTRTIIIIPQLLEIMKLHIRPSGFVLTSTHENGEKPMTQQAVRCLKQKIADTAKAHNVPVRFLSHRARHTVATFMNNAGADDVTITGIIGHSDVAFTKRQYTNTQTTQLERGMERFSNFVASISA